MDFCEIDNEPNYLMLYILAKYNIIWNFELEFGI